MRWQLAPPAPGDDGRRWLPAEHTQRPLTIAENSSSSSSTVTTDESPAAVGVPAEAGTSSSNVSGATWKGEVEDAIWHNSGLPVMLTIQEARAILEQTSDVYATAEVYFEDFSGIEVPKVRKGQQISKPFAAPKGKNASELPNSQISDIE